MVPDLFRKDKLESSGFQEVKGGSIFFLEAQLNNAVNLSLETHPP